MTMEHATGRVRLSRDHEQWGFDRVIKDTGRVQHFQSDARGPLPKAVRSHAMISKHTGLAATKLEQLAREELDAGHRSTALDLFFEASLAFASAQHPIFSINEEKQLLHRRSIQCYDEVRRLAPYRIERVEVPWESSAVVGNLHLVPGVEPRPCVLFVPGCDMTKEMYPHPRWNHALQRDLHLCSFDGPGQGEANLRNLVLTADNYEAAASAMITELLGRPEITEVVVYGISFGSYWALRLAATDDRVRAVVAPWASCCDKYYLMTEESPRYRQLFAHLTRAASEDELLKVMAAMDNRDDLARLTCPAALMVGEYDPRSPLDEVLDLFSEAMGDVELWVFADQHHQVTVTGALQPKNWMNDIHAFAMDWLADRIADTPMPHAGHVLYLDGRGPNAPQPVYGGRWYGHFE